MTKRHIAIFAAAGSCYYVQGAGAGHGRPAGAGRATKKSSFESRRRRARSSQSGGSCSSCTGHDTQQEGRAHVGRTGAAVIFILRSVVVWLVVPLVLVSTNCSCCGADRSRCREKCHRLYCSAFRMQFRTKTVLDRRVFINENICHGRA